MFRFFQKVVPIFFIFSLLLYSLLYAEEALNKTSKRIFYAFSIKKAEGITATLKLNDVPFRIMDQEAYSTSGTANEWIIPGENNITILIKPPEKPTSEPVDAAHPGLSILITEAEEGQFPNEGEPVLKFEWPGKLPPEKLFETQPHFTASHAPPSDFWQNAKPIELTENAKKQIRALVSRVHDAFIKSDFETIVSLLMYRAREADTALFILDATDEKRKKEILHIYKLVLKNPAKVEPLMLDELQFHLVAGNRMVWVTGKNGEPPLRVTNGDYLFKLPVYVAPVNGKWTIVR